MPIKLITGLPGHGKTLRLMQLLKDAGDKADRPVFVFGVDGLVDGPWTSLADASTWQELPDNALVFVDEAWKWFGHQSSPRGAVPAHVQALAEHRHRGFDFVWTTQGPSQIYPFARTLIAEHEHVVRRFGSRLSDVYQWGELQEDVKSVSVRARGLRVSFVHPRALYSMYKSASAHTIKMRLPLRAWALPFLLIIGALLGWYVITRFSPDAQAAKAQAGIAEVTAGARGAVGDSPGDQPGVRTPHGKAPVSAEQLAALLNPRIEGMPWTAELYDARAVKSEPDIYCISSEASCTCLSEQGTRT